ncbi:MAG: hypothetical protein WA947_06625 [Phormidesmis sp.]
MAIARSLRWRINRVKHFFRRVTLLTWFIWAALVSDLCAPGYLKFHLGITTFDANSIATEVNTAWKIATDAPEN